MPSSSLKSFLVVGVLAETKKLEVEPGWKKCDDIPKSVRDRLEPHLAFESELITKRTHQSIQVPVSQSNKNVGVIG